MTEPVALPLEHAASSRLAWRLTKTIVADDRAWSLRELAATRRWRFRVARASWIAQASIALFFAERSPPGGPGAVFSIHFEGRGSVAALENSPLFQTIMNQFDASNRRHERIAIRVVRGETRPHALLAELDRIGAAFGSNDRHRASSRSRSLHRRLMSIGDALVAGGAWAVAPSLIFDVDTPASYRSASIMPMSSGRRGHPELSTMLFVSDASGSHACVARAEAVGYVDVAGGPDRAMWKHQPLSVRAGVAEARRLKQLVA